MLNAWFRRVGTKQGASRVQEKHGDESQWDPEGVHSWGGGSVVPVWVAKRGETRRDRSPLHRRQPSVMTKMPIQGDKYDGVHRGVSE